MVTDLLRSADTWLFYAVNHGMANPLFDSIMPFITDFSKWKWVYLGILVFIAVRGGRYRWVALVTLLVGVGLCDLLNAKLLKAFIDRDRPFEILEGVNQLVGASGSSFPSNHAANNFGLAILVRHFYPRWTVPVYVMAVSIAFSRVYCGVHFPFDVVVGALTGTLIGFGTCKLSDFFVQWWNSRLRGQKS